MTVNAHLRLGILISQHFMTIFPGLKKNVDSGEEVNKRRGKRGS